MDVVIGHGYLDGKGVYAARDFRKGEVVIHYHLSELSDDALAQLPEREKQFVHTHHGVDYLYAEPERYVNHAESPNTFQDLRHQCDIALRDIRAGEEITTDSSRDDI